MDGGRGWAWVVAAACLIAAGPGRAAEAHVHGIAKLDVIAEGTGLVLRLETPLENLVGFERAPRNNKEQAAVRKMADALRSDKAFVPTRAARCKLGSVNLESAVLHHGLLGNPPPAAKHDQDDDHDDDHHDKDHDKDHAQGKGHGHDKDHGHADLVVDYMFQCADAAALVGLEVGLFDTFKGLERIDVQVVGPRGQTGAKLTPKSRRVSW
jgi:hypothetical protein